MTSRLPVVGMLLAALVTSVGRTGSGRAVQDRLDVDITTGKPIVINAVVAGCDSVDQGIAPVPRALGDGQDPQTYLFWGA